MRTVMTFALVLVAATFAFAGDEPSLRAGDSATSFILRAEVREVVVHVSVTDRSTHEVPELTRNNFELSENGVPVPAFTSFRRDENMPLRIGIVIDSSGSTEKLCAQEADAAAAFLKNVMKPGDTGFVAKFADSLAITQDWTSDVDQLHAGMKKVNGWGMTSMYDSVISAASKFASMQEQQAVRRVLLLITDGDDNNSRHNAEDTLQALAASDVLMFAVGFNTTICSGNQCSDEPGKAILQKMSRETGGRAFFPRQRDDLARIGRDIQNDLRSYYSIAYVPPRSESGYRRLKVRLTGIGGRYHLRHRSGYNLPPAPLR